MEPINRSLDLAELTTQAATSHRPSRRQWKSSLGRQGDNGVAASVTLTGMVCQERGNIHRECEVYGNLSGRHGSSQVPKCLGRRFCKST